MSFIQNQSVEVRDEFFETSAFENKAGVALHLDQMNQMTFHEG